MTRAPRILTAAVAIAASIGCGSTSSNTVAGPSPAKCELTATNNTPSFHRVWRSGRNCRAGRPRMRVDGRGAGELGCADAARGGPGRVHAEIQRADEPLRASAAGIDQRGGAHGRGRPGGRGVPVRSRSQPGADWCRGDVGRRERAGADGLRVDRCDGCRLAVRDAGRAGKRARAGHHSCARECGRSTCGHGADRRRPARGHAALRLRGPTATTGGLLVRTAARVRAARCVRQRKAPSR